MHKDNCVIQYPELQNKWKNGVETRLLLELNYTVHFHRSNFSSPPRLELSEHSIIHIKFHVTTVSTAFQCVACWRRRPARYNRTREIQAIPLIRLLSDDLCSEYRSSYTGE